MASVIGTISVAVVPSDTIDQAPFFPVAQTAGVYQCWLVGDLSSGASTGHYFNLGVNPYLLKRLATGGPGVVTGVNSIISGSPD